MFKVGKFLSSQEGKILFIGLALLFTYIISLASVYLFSTKDANSLVVMTFTNLFFGRAAGISYGYTVEFSDFVIIMFNIVIETILVLLIYPLFVMGWHKSINIKMLRHFMISVKKQRIKYKDFFEKYGKYGLFVFVWFPFWMTGPVVGAIIGFLIGIKHYVSIAIVIAGTSLAIVIWTYFLKELIKLLNYVSSYGAYIILISFVLLALVLKFARRKKTTKEGSDSDVDL